MKNDDKNLYEETLDRFKNAKQLEFDNTEVEIISNEDSSAILNEDLEEEIIEVAFDDEAFDKYLENLFFNNNISLTKDYLKTLKGVSLVNITKCLEDTILWMHDHQLRINYFDFDEIVRYIKNNEIVVAEKYVNMLSKLDETFLFSTFDETEIDKDNYEEIVQLRKEIMLLFRNEKNVPDRLIDKFRDMVGRGEESDFYRLLKNVKNKIRTASETPDVEGVLLSINDYLYAYPNEQSALVLYLYICSCHDYKPNINDGKLEVVLYGETVKVLIDFTKMIQNRLPFKYYYLAMAQYKYGDKDSAIQHFTFERQLHFGAWDDEAINIIGEERVQINYKETPDDILRRRKIARIVSSILTIITTIILLYIVLG